MRLGADLVARAWDVRAVGHCADWRRLLADADDDHSAAWADHDDDRAARGDQPLRRLVSVDVVELAQRVDAHHERMRGGDNDHDDAFADHYHDSRADYHNDDRGCVRSARDDDHLDYHHEQHDHDDGGP